MFRILAFFTVTLLFFSMMPSTSAQQNSVQEQAETDALRDVDHDTPKEMLFMLGLAGSSTGLVAGCVGGCVLGTFIDDRIYFAHDDPLTNCGIPGAILLGICAVPTIALAYPHNPNPPLERLLGKSPEYVGVYTQVYRSKTISLRKRLLTAGSITSNLGAAGTILLFIINN